LVDASATCLPPYTVRVPVFEGAVNTCGCTCSDSGQGCASPVMNVSAGSSSCMSPGTVTATTNVCSPLGFSDSYSTPFGTGDVKCDMDATPDTAVTARAFCCQP
jgi:hypothetical protein